MRIKKVVIEKFHCAGYFNHKSVTCNACPKMYEIYETEDDDGNELEEEYKYYSKHCHIKPSVYFQPKGIEVEIRYISSRELSDIVGRFFREIENELKWRWDKTFYISIDDAGAIKDFPWTTKKNIRWQFDYDSDGHSDYKGGGYWTDCDAYCGLTFSKPRPTRLQYWLFKNFYKAPTISAPDTEKVNMRCGLFGYQASEKKEE